MTSQSGDSNGFSWCRPILRLWRTFRCRKTTLGKGRRRLATLHSQRLFCLSFAKRSRKIPATLFSVAQNVWMKVFSCVVSLPALFLSASCFCRHQCLLTSYCKRRFERGGRMLCSSVGDLRTLLEWLCELLSRFQHCAAWMSVGGCHPIAHWGLCCAVERPLQRGEPAHHPSQSPGSFRGKMFVFEQTSSCWTNEKQTNKKTL